MAEPPPELIDELYGAALDEFTPLRDARAKELRKSDRAAADAVKKLRKPSVPAWAVNQLARRAGEDVEALLAAGAALRQVQLGGAGDRDAIRSASRDEREAVERLVEQARAVLAEAGRGAGPAALEDVRETLHAAASDDDARELIRRGALTEARQAVGLGGGFEAAFAAVPAASPAPARGKKQPKGKGKGKPAPKAEPDADARKREREAEAERKRAAKERAKEARTALREAERAAREAESDLSAAERDRDAAQAALDRAQRTVDRAQRDVDEAHAQAERRRAELDELA